MLGEACASADRNLVRACLGGDQGAWDALVERYQALVYSIILELDEGREDPAAQFAMVWLEILMRIREPKARADFCSWLVDLTLAACSSSAQHTGRRCVEHLLELQRLRSCLAELPPPCRAALMAYLATEPARPGEEVARQLGIPAADWPAVLQTCLGRLQRSLVRHGLV